MIRSDLFLYIAVGGICILIALWGWARLEESVDYGKKQCITALSLAAFLFIMATIVLVTTK